MKDSSDGAIIQINNRLLREKSRCNRNANTSGMSDEKKERNRCLSLARPGNCGWQWPAVSTNPPSSGNDINPEDGSRA